MYLGYFDGASRGNPGDAGAGACILDSDGNIIWESHDYLGKKTNNEAEYEALIRVLTEAKKRGITDIEIRGDSRLVIEQVSKKWKINVPHLRELAALAWKEMEGVRVKLVWVPREKNTIADELSNRAIDSRACHNSTKKEASVRWTGEQKTEMVLDILKGKVSFSETAQKYDLAVDQLEKWVDTALKAVKKSLS